MTGDDEPDVGSTAVAIANPDEDAIFSPANTAAEKIIDRISPAETPIIISVIPITMPFAEVMNPIGGSIGFNEITIIVRVMLIRILTGSITNFAPNKGDANKNEPILRLANKNCAISSRMPCSFSPGRAPTPSLKRLNM